MKAAKQRAFDVVLVFRFDRFARSSMHLATALAEFQSLGIDFVSHNEAIDTSTPMGKMVFHVLAAVAELELGIIRERVAAGAQATTYQAPLEHPSGGPISFLHEPQEDRFEPD